MDRKMRAKRNNAEEKAKRESSYRPLGVIFTNQHSGQEVNRVILPTGDTLPVLVDHDKKGFEILPEKSEMS